MPVQGTKLLAGAAALLGLSLGSVGCHTVSTRNHCCATEHVSGYAATDAPSVVMSHQPVAALQKPQRRPLFGPSPVVYQRPVAAPLQPVPATLITGDQSTWAPVRRVSAESSASDPTLPMPMPAGKGEVVKAAAPPAKKTGTDVLPAPKMQPTYPALPAVAVTHPLDAPREFNKRSLSAYIIEPPDVLQIDAPADLLSPDKSVVLSGPALVAPDGTIRLGTLGGVFVAGLTLDQAKEAVARVIQTQQPKEDLDVILRKIKLDVAAYNSKFYYVISDGAGYGEQVIKVPVTGNETVLDAIAQIQGLPAVSSKKRIWLARATPHGYGAPHVLPIDWCNVAMAGSGSTNYQMFPGDRLYIQSDRLLNFNSALGKVLAPVERILGVTLLGSSVVNSIRQGGNNGGGGNNNTN